MAETLLKIDHLTQRFGGITAVLDLNFEVEEGSIVSLIGPNGAGKTTLFNCVTGIYEPTEGDITFKNQSICGIKPHDICELGIARTFQNIRLFSGMTIEENVLIGRHCRTSSGLIDSFAHLSTHRKDQAEGRSKAAELLEFVGLDTPSDEVAANLPYGHQRRLEIARAMPTEPTILLLDEPAAGLTTPEKIELKELVSAVRAQGVTIVLIEHCMRFVMDISDKIIVLDYGEKIAEGTAEEIQKNQTVIDAYLGTE